jgi:hypothetical protein
MPSLAKALEVRQTMSLTLSIAGGGNNVLIILVYAHRTSAVLIIRKIHAQMFARFNFRHIQNRILS